MITASYGLTATERVLPRLALDFTTASLDPRVTVTRALDTATVTNADGSISIVNANLPRFDYLNGVCRGLLIEEARTNALFNSVFAGAVAGSPGTAPTNWTDLVATGTIASVSAGTYAAGNAIRITNTGTRRAFYRTQSVLANTTYSYSITVTVHSTPVAGYPRIQDCMFLASGPAGSTITYQLNGATATAGTAVPNGQTSKVVAILAVGATAGTVEVRCGLGSTSTVDGDITIQMPQFEAGAFPTSYIPTTTTSLTRNADAVSMTGTNFTSWFNATVSGTAVASAITKGGLNNTVYVFDDTNSTQYANIIIAAANGSSTTGTMAYDVRANSVTTYSDRKASQMTNNSLFNTALFFANSNFSSATNGGTPATQTSGAVPASSNILRLGSHRDGTILNGWLVKFAYYSPPIISAQTQAFSK